MKVIVPVVTTPAMLTSSTIAEPDAGETAWVSGTTYAAGDVRILTSTHRKYTRLVAGAGTTAPNLDTINWLDTGPTNRWAMLALDRNLQSTSTSTIIVAITPGIAVDALGLVGLQCNSATIVCTVSAVTKYTNTIVTLNRPVVNWFQYFFAPFNYRPSAVMFNLPTLSVADAAIAIFTITLTGASTNKCGGVVLGNQVDLGKTQYSATSSALNFSTITRDVFGNATLVPRRSVPKTDQRTEIASWQVDILRAARTKLNATTALWCGMDDKTTEDYFEALVIMGIYKEFSISLDHPRNATVTLQIEEI